MTLCSMLSEFSLRGILVLLSQSAGCGPLEFSQEDPAGQWEESPLDTREPVWASYRSTCSVLGVGVQGTHVEGVGTRMAMMGTPVE